MKKIILSALVIAVSVAFVSCKKDKKETCSLSASSIVGTYKVTSVKYKATAASAEQEIFTDDTWFDACERDDTYAFDATNVLTYTDAGVSCGGGGSFNTTWSLSGNTLTLTGFGAAGTVSDFNCSSMKLTVNEFDVPGDVAVFTFARQ